ncbi:MAG: hypothetical protein EA416_10350 [Trueperaceae bacterium]|nr:MAG: hypothetical protein EA416_10350 [Trueperaceae bacterium]
MNARSEGIATPRPGRHGVALISVLLVMVSIVLLGVGSLVLTRMNLLIAENLVGATIARSHADAGIDATVAALFERLRVGQPLPSSLETATATLVPEGALAYALVPGDGYVVHGDSSVALRVAGTGPRNAEYVAEAFVVFALDGAASGGASPFDGVVVGCEGVDLRGSGRIDSYHSGVGPYLAAHARENAVVRTTEVGANVLLNGNAPIHGNVVSTGAFEATGSSEVRGSISANGTVAFRANATYGGDVRTTGDVLFTNTAQVAGSVSANGSVTFGNGARVASDTFAGGSIAFNNSGARVFGDARAGGTITRGHGNSSVVHVTGSTSEHAGTVANPPVPSEACDPLGIADVMAAYAGIPSSGPLQTGYPRNRWELSPTGVRAFDETWNVRDWVDQPSRPTHAVDVFGQPRTMIKTGTLNLGNGELRITGGDVVLFVDGDLNLGTGGGPGLVIDDDSSLTVFVTGRTRIASAVQMPSTEVVRPGGTPAFALFSNYRDTGAYTPWGHKGVSIEGNARLAATVYAPEAYVSVNAGGGMYGATRGRRVDVTGGGGLHFDEALLDLALGGGSPSAGTGEPSVTIRSRR